MLKEQKKLQNKRVKKAFTFIELLLAFTIFSIVATSVYYTLTAGLNVYKYGNNSMKQNQQLRTFFDFLSNDLANAVNYSKILPKWQKDRLAFTALVDSFYNDQSYSQIAKILYELNKEKKTVVRKEAAVDLGFNEDFSSGNDLLENVDDVSFSYCFKSLDSDNSQDFEWKNIWPKIELLPRAVKVKVVFLEKQGLTKKIYEKIIFIPSGSIGKQKWI